MLDFGWAELLVVIALLVIVVGPNEIPVLMVGLGRVFRRLQYIKFAISQQFDDVMHDADLGDIRKSVNFEDKNFDEAEADAEYAVVPDTPSETPPKEEGGSDE